MKLHYDSLAKISLIILIIQFQSCAGDPPRKDLDCKVAINKEYKISSTKSSLIDKFKTNPTFINIADESKDSIFYFDITILDKSATFGYKTKIIQNKRDTLTIIIDSIVNCRLIGKFMVGIKQENIAFCNALKRNDFVNYFENSVINKAENKESSIDEKVILNFMY